MEDYPADYTAHNLPLVLLSGLGEPEDANGRSSDTPRPESGTRLGFSSPECEGQKAQVLLQQFLEHDGSDRAWNAGSLQGPLGNLRYCMKPMGRTYTLAPRKAAPPPQSASVEGPPNRQRSPSKSSDLHSPLSPLSPVSPLFPDGVFTPQWLVKHQSQVPSMIVAFFDMTAGEEASQDDQIKADINAVRSALARSGFRTRFAAVLLSDKSILHAPELEERLSSIRRATSLDTKTGLFFMPPMSSQAEISTFVHGIMSTLQPLCVEYYRDLTKHARRKKTRGSVPAPSSMSSGGAAKTLSNLGWNARYEIKQGVFAEFRQEMDVAERHYSQAIEDLFHPEGTFENTPSWSPRWDEARLLSDAVALRAVRCLLWNGLTTGAVTSWSNYRGRMRDLVDRRGKGSQTYSWEAWESRWAKVMAELTQRASLPVFHIQPKQNMADSAELSSLRTYAVPEKSFPGAERVAPFRLLHHAGYWLRLALKGSRARWQRAMAIPEEDRTPPGQSPASAVASRAQVYDHYLTPDPHEEFPLPGEKGFDHLAVISALSNQTIMEFAGRGQTRLGDQAKLDIGRDLVSTGQYEEAMQILAPLYQENSWREDDWHALFGELLSLLHSCSKKTNQAELVLTTTWELLSGLYALDDEAPLDLSNSLVDLNAEESEKLEVHFNSRERCSPISVKFAFANRQGFVGEPMGCQLILSSSAPAQAKNVTLAHIQLEIGSLSPLTISHDGETDDKLCTDIVKPALDKEAFPAKANLVMRPGQKRVFNFTITLRGAETVGLKKATICVATAQFKLKHSFEDEETLQSKFWYHPSDKALKDEMLFRRDTSTITVLPKPPKIQVRLHDLKKQYYVGEQVRLQVEVVNGEEDTVNGTISRSVAAQDETGLDSMWVETGEPSDLTESAPVATNARRDLSALKSSAAFTLDVVISPPVEAFQHSLTIDVDYTLESEPNTPLKKTILVELPYAKLLEPKFNFGPLLHTDPWPSYFDPSLESSEEQPSGIVQKWRLGTQLTSLAADAITFRGADIITDHIANDAVLTKFNKDQDKERAVTPKSKFDTEFQFTTQKTSLDDRRPTIVELSLAIRWSREADSTTFTTVLPMPRLSIPSSEPRVLCSVVPNDDSDADVVLQYHLENPSVHFLTFALTMEASEDFAFGGVKHRNLSLAPLSRHHIEFRIIAHHSGDEAKGGRWVFPVLQVVDSFYQKTLRVQPAGPGVKIDAQRGLAVWIPGHRS